MASIRNLNFKLCSCIKYKTFEGEIIVLNSDKNMYLKLSFKSVTRKGRGSLARSKNMVFYIYATHNAIVDMCYMQQHEAYPRELLRGRA